MNTNLLWATLALTIVAFAAVVWFRGDIVSMGRNDETLMERGAPEIIGNGEQTGRSERTLSESDDRGLLARVERALTDSDDRALPARDGRGLLARGGRALLEFFAEKDATASESRRSTGMLARFSVWLAKAERPASAVQQIPLATAAPAEPANTVFKTDSVGQIVTDEAARLEIERLVALNSPDELQDRLQQIAQSLPPAAANRLPDLIERYASYSTALRETYPPEQIASSEQEALAQLDGLHALRTQYFGAEVAEGFFAEEEKTQRELIELMRPEKDQSLTMAESTETRALLQASSDSRGRN